MLDLSLAAKLEKNKVSSTGVWIVLLEVQFQGATIRICNNNEDVTWNGQTWIGYPLQIDPIDEDGKGELPQFTIRISNITGAMQQYLEQYTGGVDATVILRLVHSAHLDLITPEFEGTYIIIKTPYDDQWVYFNLGPDFVITQRVPLDIYKKAFCSFKLGSVRCGYDGIETDCDGTLIRCRELNNSERFGGEPGIPA